MATTSTAPISIPQINQTYYVGEGFLQTIQQAVTFAVIGGSGAVIIPAGYTGSDSIGAVTGGSAGVFITDQRNPQQPQNYVWGGSSYAAADFAQAHGFIAKGVSSTPASSAVLHFNPAGTSGAGTAHLDYTAPTGMGMPALNINGVPGDGTPFVTFMRLQNSIAAPGIVAGIPQIEAPIQLQLFNGNYASFNAWIGGFYLAGGKGMSIWARADENAIDLQGETIGGAYDQTIRLNYLGGGVEIGPITFDGSGNITGIDNLVANDVSTSTLGADSADFDTCIVNDSPVRTFANTPDGPGQGMVWPEIGIPVSLGSSWQDPSIDPTTLATASMVGIPVSDGTAWLTPIDPATVPRLNVANTFTQSMTVQGTYVATEAGTTTAYSSIGTAPNLAIGQRFISLLGLTNATGMTFAMGFNNGGAAASNYAFFSLGGTSGETRFDTTGAWTFPASITTAGAYVSTQTGTGTLYDGIVLAPNVASGQRFVRLSGLSNATGMVLATGVANNGSVASNFAFFNLGGSSAETHMDYQGNWTIPGSMTISNIQSNNVALNLSTLGGFPINFSNVLQAHGVVNEGSTAPAGINLGLGSDVSSPIVMLKRGSGGVANQNVADTTLFAGAILFRFLDDAGNATIWMQTTRTGATPVQTAIYATTTIVKALKANNICPWDATIGGVAIGVGSDGGSPVIITTSAGAGTDSKAWGQVTFGNSYNFFTYNDAGATVTNWLSVSRSGATATGAVFGIPLTVNGTLTVNGNKAFRITHPADDTKWLTHSTLEGPEIAVFYRGESMTDGGWAEIALPDYFEPLTVQEKRSVLVTALFEQDDDPIGPLAASRVKNGKFKVWSAVPKQKFYWEVKAVRSDQPPLVIVSDRSKEEETPWKFAPEMEAMRQAEAKANTKKSGGVDEKPRTN